MKSKIHLLKFSVTPEGREVQTNSEATLSCVVGGLTQELESVVWKRGDDDVKTLGDNYVQVNGSIVGTSQTTTLQVKDVGLTDTDYKCIVKENVTAADVETTVTLAVFSKYLST